MHQSIEDEQLHQHVRRGGSHSCQVYSSDTELSELIIPFFIRGISSQYKCVCATDSFTQTELVAMFSKKNFDITPFVDSGQFTRFSSRETYAQTGIFDANRTLLIFKKYCESAVLEGYKGIYVSGDASWSLSNETSINRLIDYESKVNTLTSVLPIVGLCLYDANSISFRTLYDILRVHPEIRVDDTQIKSPHYVPPDMYERIKDSSASAKDFLETLSQLKSNELQRQSYEETRKSHISELELLNSTMVDRELKMIELKSRIAELEKSQTSKT